MLRPNVGNANYPVMTPAEFQQFSRAVAEELAGKEENTAAAKDHVPELVDQCAQAAAVMSRFRQARQAAGVSLAEMESRTGIRKSVLSRLENSKAPNPTLGTLQRYAAALGRCVAVSIED